MKTEIGCLCMHDEFYLEGKKFKIIGRSSYRSFNSILCYNETKKRRWLDQGSMVEVHK